MLFYVVVVDNVSQRSAYYKCDSQMIYVSMEKNYKKDETIMEASPTLYFLFIATQSRSTYDHSTNLFNKMYVVVEFIIMYVYCLFH